jgi:triacylglycerol lipase
MFSPLVSCLIAAGVAVATPIATIKNGSYSGVYNPTYQQDFFLGIPYAQVSKLPDTMRLEI